MFVNVPWPTQSSVSAWSGNSSQTVPWTILNAVYLGHWERWGGQGKEAAKKIREDWVRILPGPSQPCHFGQVTLPPRASVSPSVARG